MLSNLRLVPLSRTRVQQSRRLLHLPRGQHQRQQPCHHPRILLGTNTRSMSTNTPHSTSSSDLDTKNSPSVSAAELEKFTSISSTWWDTQGPFKYLHTMNIARLQFVRQRLEDLGISLNANTSVVDVGCGGGLATESLARLGLSALGIDAAQENIAVARLHAQNDPLLSIEYRQMTAEQAVAEPLSFDSVVSFEVIEHVNDPVHFVKSLVDLAKPGAPIFLSTMNRTLVSLFVDVVVPEYLMNSVPKGTHNHSKFIAPEELSDMLAAFGAETLSVEGLVLEPLFNTCHLVPRDLGLLRNAGVQANYVLCARKKRTL
ncbi:Hexaprenyldihydroxybenzoate methyltransferase, mitochondrial [Coemansia sp. Benny D115]|nr:Hexaprenyldihydroxybenzoate methyltransferase, mitochondrial [Coemansia sp. Benny D115]